MDHIHRLRIIDEYGSDTGDYAIVKISSNNKIFMNIEATEGESPFKAQYAKDGALRLREKKQLKSDKEWEHLILDHLLKTSPRVNDGASKLDRNVEIVAIKSDSELTITVRRKLEGGVTQRLGAIPVKKDEDLEVDTFSWTHSVIAQRDELASDIESLRSRYSNQEATIAKLTTQLDDLIQAKQEHENALMGKFCQLLNAKKLKIRDQQRLLASAKVDDQLAAEIRTARGRGDQGPPEKSRKGKRKAAPQPQDEQEDEDEAFSGVPITSEVKEESDRADSEEVEKQQTPSDSETADETTDEDVQDTRRPARNFSAAKSNGAKISQDDDVDMGEAPAARSLPFQAPTTTRSQEKQESVLKEGAGSSTLLQQSKGDSDGETTDEDDEL